METLLVYCQFYFSLPFMYFKYSLFNYCLTNIKMNYIWLWMCLEHKFSLLWFKFVRVSVFILFFLFHSLALILLYNIKHAIMLMLMQNYYGDNMRFLFCLFSQWNFVRAFKKMRGMWTVLRMKRKILKLYFNVRSLFNGSAVFKFIFAFLFSFSHFLVGICVRVALPAPTIWDRNKKKIKKIGQ